MWHSPDCAKPKSSLPSCSGRQDTCLAHAATRKRPRRCDESPRRTRSSAGCTATGKRQPQIDLDCKARIKNGWSGYCECEGGRRTKEVGCEHAAFRCKDECRKLFEEDSKPVDDAAEEEKKESRQPVKQ